MVYNITKIIHLKLDKAGFFEYGYANLLWKQTAEREESREQIMTAKNKLRPREKLLNSILAFNISFGARCS